MLIGTNSASFPGLGKEVPLGGSFSFNADTAFIHSVDNNLYIGKDNTISCLSISK